MTRAHHKSESLCWISINQAKNVTYKLTNQMKKENMNCQPYCLLMSLVDSKPYRIWNCSLNYMYTDSLKQESIKCLQRGR